MLLNIQLFIIFSPVSCSVIFLVSRGFCSEKYPCGRTKLEFYKKWKKEYVGDRPTL